MYLISETLKFSRIMNAAAAAQTTVTSSAIDCQGFDSFVALLSVGSVAAGGSAVATLHYSDDNSDYTAISASAIDIADDDDNGICIFSLGNLKHRYYKLVVTRADADSSLDGCIVALTRAFNQTEPLITTAIGTVALVGV